MRTALRGMMLVLAAALGGCSATELVQGWSSEPAPDLSQPNHRRVVLANFNRMFPDPDRVGEVEISGVRAVDHLKGAAWITCLRLDARGHPQHYAVFIQADNVIDWRAGVVIDQCHNETYTPFEIPAAMRRPATGAGGAAAGTPAAGVPSPAHAETGARRTQ
jgi:hypothetical protein